MADPFKPAGDPEGKKIAKQKAAWLREASLLGRCLEVLLKRADCELPVCAELLNKIGNQEKNWFGKSGGRVEPRRKYKGLSKHPLLEERLTNILYVDESGQSPPEKKPSPGVPSFFSLAAISIREELKEDYCERADKLK